ncbi:MAG: hypothetical protein FWG77_00315 [Treponema sp.]|nr:hypothetical protein [Treponema sp.]
MSTIPTTFNDLLPSYTAVGGTERRASTGLSAVILNRGGRYPRFTLFEELEKIGFDYVLSMESSANRYDLESLSGSFPFVRFVLLKDAVSSGEEINLAASELSSPLFFVLWNDIKVLRGGGAERMAERLQSGSEDKSKPYKRLCTVPMIQDGRSDTIPTLIAPALVPEKSGGKSSIRTIPFISEKEGLPSLYPFDGIGIYDRERFIRLGGFDPMIKSFYWQLMDFGFRSHLWGEEIAGTQLIKLGFEGSIPPEDRTIGESWRWFYLKNLAPVFRRDYAHIPLGRFPSYLKKRGSLMSAWEEFSAARIWVKTNCYRFTSDARTIAERFPYAEREENHDGPYSASQA